MQSRYAGTVTYYFAIETRLWLQVCTRLKNTTFERYWWNFRT